jgi:hypothetical protein
MEINFPTTIERTNYGFLVNGERIAELSAEQLLAVAATGDPSSALLFPAGVQSAFAEAYCGRIERNDPNFKF